MAETPEPAIRLVASQLDVSLSRVLRAD